MHFTVVTVQAAFLLLVLTISAFMQRLTTPFKISLGHRHSCHHYLTTVFILPCFALWIVFYTTHDPNLHILIHIFFNKHILTIFFMQGSMPTKIPRTN